MLKKILLLSFVVCLLSATGYAQYGAYGAYSRYMNASAWKKKLYQRDYVGYGKVFMTVDVKQRYTDVRYVDPDPNTVYTTGGKVVDTSIRTTYRATSSINYTEGTFFPLQKVGREGLIAIDLSTTFNITQYSMGKIEYSSTTGVEEEGISEQISVPIGIVYKSGGEVNLNKKSRFLFTIGCGIAPYMSASKFIAYSDLTFGARQYVMAEFGVFAGIAWKVRATVYTGNLTLLDNRYADIFDADSYHTNGYGNLDIKVTSGPCATVSLLINPFSWDWKGKGDNYSYWNKSKY